MASQHIKGITIEIGAETTELNKALNKFESETGKINTQLREVNRLLKYDPKNVELLSQKHTLLCEKVENAKEQLKMLRSIETEMAQKAASGEISGEQYAAYRREVINAEQSLQSLTQQLEEYEREQAQNSRTTEESSKKHKALDTTLKAVKLSMSTVKVAIEAIGKASKEVAKAGLATFEASVKAVKKEIDIGVQALGAYTKAAAAATTAVAGFAIKSGASFEQSMSKVKALSGATGEDFEKLEAKAREMGANTSKSAAESADALGYMALAGWDTTQMLTGLEPILRASEAGEMDLATCSDLVTDSMSAMGVGVDELNHYLDVCAKTQSSSNTSMQQLLEAYVGCGGTLKNMEVPLETSATLLGALANRGIKGSEAGTALNSVLVNLMGNTERTAKALDELGVSMYENGQRREINEVLDDLNVALAQCSEEQRDTFTAFLGGKTQMDTLQALLAGMSEEYDTLNEKILDSEGCLIDTAKIMQENFNGSIVAAKSAIEGLGISIFETFSVDLTNTIRTATGFISQLTSAIDDGKLFSTIHNISNEITHMVIDSMSDIAEKVSKGTDIFNKVIVSFVDFISNTLPSVTEKILPAVMQGLLELVNSLTARLPSIVPKVAKAAVTLFGGLLDGMQKISQRLAGFLPEIISSLLGTVVRYLPRFFETGISIITTLISGIQGRIPNIILTAISMLETMVTTIAEQLPIVIEAGVTILRSVIVGIADTIPTLMETIGETIMTIITVIMENLPKILESGIQILVSVIQGITNMLPDLIDTIVDLVILIVDVILDNLDLIIDVALDLIVALITGILNNLPELAKKIPEIVETVVDTLIDHLDEIIDAGVQIIASLIVGIVDSIPSVVETAWEVSAGIVDAFFDIDWAEVGSNILNSIGDGIKNAASGIGNTISDVGSSIAGFFGDIDIPFFANGGTLTHGSAIVGEAGAELLTVMNGRAIVQPLTRNTTNNTSAMSSKNEIHITNVIQAEIKNDYDITRINEQLAFEQQKQYAALGVRK